MTDRSGQLRRIYEEQVASRPLIALCETWQDEAGIDAAIWTVTDPVGGVAWSRGASGAYLRATSVPNLNEFCRLVSDQRWVFAPNVFSNNTVLRRSVLEFELKLTDVANIDNANSFFGLTTGVGDDRTSNNIIGFALLADVFQSVTDLAVNETTNTDFHSVTAEATWNKLVMDVYAGHVDFYINNNLVASHITNLPDYPFYLNWYLDTEAGGAATIELGIVRVWHEDVYR